MLCARKKSRREKKTYLDDNFFVFFSCRGMGSTCYWNSAWKHKEVGMKAVCRLMALEFSATVTPGVWLTPEHSLPTAVFPSPTFLTSELLSCQSVTLSHVLESHTSLSKYLTNKMGLKLCWQRWVIMILPIGSYSSVCCLYHSRCCLWKENVIASQNLHYVICSVL